MRISTADDIKKHEIRLIKIGQRDLKLDDATYRAMLWSVARVKSATELDWTGRKKVLDHMKARGFTVKKSKHRQQAPRNLERSDLMKKIGAQLADAQLAWEYAHGIAHKMFRIDRLDFCTPAHLHKIVAALEYAARRREKKRIAAEVADMEETV